MTQFSLSWGAHQNNICTGLSALQQNGEFVDMTLAADGHHVKVHQLVLSLASPYLKDIITSTQCRHPVVFLNKISYATLCAILEYIYTGEVLIKKENLNELIAAGKELHINGLQDMEVDISAKSNAAGTQVAGYNEGHQLTPGNPKEPERTPITRAKLTTPLQGNTSISYKENETNYLSDNADITLDDPMDAESPSPGRETNLPAKKKDKSETRIQYTLSNQGALQLILNRYLYFLEYTSTRDRSVRRWRCTDNRYNKCQALIITKGEVVVQRKHAHIHPFHDKKVLKKVRDKAIFTALADAQEHVHQNKINTAQADPTTN